MMERLAGEILDAINNTGGAVKKKKIHTKWQKPTRHLHITDGNTKIYQWVLSHLLSA